MSYSSVMELSHVWATVTVLYFMYDPVLFTIRYYIDRNMTDCDVMQ